jgi:hypothetical protein
MGKFFFYLEYGNSSYGLKPRSNFQKLLNFVAHKRNFCMAKKKIKRNYKVGKLFISKKLMSLIYREPLKIENRPTISLFNVINNVIM